MRNSNKYFKSVIWLSLDKSRAGSQKILHGIAEYSRHNGPWKIYSKPPFYKQTNKQSGLGVIQLPNDNVDGIITYITNKHQINKLLRLNIPTIVIPMKKIVPEFINIIGDWEKPGIMAAEYFLDLGLKNFAYCSGVENWIWSVEREKSFSGRIQKAGFNSYRYQAPKAKALHSWDKEMPYLINWLKSLPKPTGILAWNDERGQNIIDACVAANIQIPDEVAVLGMDNDDLICNLSTVPLSSIAFNHKKVGYEAASVLHEMIKQKKTIKKNISIEPLYVVARKSTDILKMEDEDLANAIKFIRDNTTRNLTVDEVVKYISISQRTLQKKFKKFHNRSLHDEIRHHRIERVCRMLEETNLTVSQISNMLNFSEVSDLNRSFKKIKMTTPSNYRKRYSAKVILKS